MWEDHHRIWRSDSRIVDMTSAERAIYDTTQDYMVDVLKNHHYKLEHTAVNGLGSINSPYYSIKITRVKDNIRVLMLAKAALLQLGVTIHHNTYTDFLLNDPKFHENIANLLLERHSFLNATT
jgi:hypothetical protein